MGLDDKKHFASVLAEVIPLVLLSLIVEARNPDQVEQIVETPGSDIVGVVVRSVVVMTGLAFLEVAALLTVGDQVSSCIEWVAGPPGAIGVGMLLVVTGGLSLQRLAAACHRQARGAISYGDLCAIRHSVAWLETLSTAAAISFTLWLWPPSTAGCDSCVVSPWFISLLSIIGLIWRGSSLWRQAKQVHEVRQREQRERTTQPAT